MPKQLETSPFAAVPVPFFIVLATTGNEKGEELPLEEGILISLDFRNWVTVKGAKE